ncbi:MAG: hypothetical protein OEO79_03675 [Gemmatimonadota bacterium]|nr:hypothetical protein [Gemmatimonadota bacterium]MDH3421901.1 hypothetical protein [Gemmatimonadota bacterium]
MIRATFGTAAGMLVCLGLSAAPLAAQTVTGPEVHRKGAGLPAASDALGLGEDWLSWSEDELVARTIHTPIKLKGLRGVGADARMALKPLMGRGSDQIRSVLTAYSAGDIDPVTARRLVEEALEEYRIAVEELLAVR